MPAGAGILSGSDIPVRNEGFLTQAGEFHSDLWNSRHHVDLCGHRAICGALRRTCGAGYGGCAVFFGLYSLLCPGVLHSAPLARRQRRKYLTRAVPNSKKPARVSLSGLL